jgi:hypothetical protein
MRKRVRQGHATRSSAGNHHGEFGGDALAVGGGSDVFVSPTYQPSFVARVHQAHLV